MFLLHIHSLLTVLYELDLDDILQQKCTTTQLSEALRGNTQIKRVKFLQYSYPLDNFNNILDALAETKVHKISVGPKGENVAAQYAMAVSKKVHAISSLVKLDLHLALQVPSH